MTFRFHILFYLNGTFRVGASSRILGDMFTGMGNIFARAVQVKAWVVTHRKCVSFAPVLFC